MFFISWGTTSRIRACGDRAEFCPGCLQPTRFTVKTLQTANHLYGIPLGYAEVARYGECSICGARIEPMFANDVAQVGTLSFESLLAKTNPRLTPERIEVLMGVAGEAEYRLEQALRYFLSKLDSIMKEECKHWGNYTQITLLCMLVVLPFVFGLGGVVVGIVCSVFAVTGMLLVRRLESAHRIARVIIPRLKAFLAAKGISFEEFEKNLKEKDFPYSKLKRHLASDRYDILRKESIYRTFVPDEVAHLFFKSRTQGGLT
jgi:hypothetical protein